LILPQFIFGFQVSLNSSPLAVIHTTQQFRPKTHQEPPLWTAIAGKLAGKQLKMLKKP